SFVEAIRNLSEEKEISFLTFREFSNISLENIKVMVNSCGNVSEVIFDSFSDDLPQKTFIYLIKKIKKDFIKFDKCFDSVVGYVANNPVVAKYFPLIFGNEGRKFYFDCKQQNFLLDFTSEKTREKTGK